MDTPSDPGTCHLGLEKARCGRLLPDCKSEKSSKHIESFITEVMRTKDLDGRKE